MRNDLNLNISIGVDKRESIKSLAEKEKIWVSAFGNEYKPDFDFSFFFKRIEKYINKPSIFSFNYKFLNLIKNNKEEYTEVINLVKNNNYRIDIKFLESLDNKKKYLLSSIFIDSIGVDNLSDGFEMGKSLFIWMSFRYNYRRNNLIDNKFEELICKIKDNSDLFHSFNFIQAYRFIKRHTEIQNLNDFFFNVIAEYNISKNIDNDIDEINKENSLNLGKDFSLGTFHTRSKLGFGREIKYGNYGLDKDGNETNIQNEGTKIMVNEKGEEVYGAYTLDRDHKSINADASGIEYQEYIDSPSGIALFYKGKPVACICFYIRNGNEFFINQIQKVVHYKYDRYGRCIGKRYSDNTKDIDWENTLYNIVKELTDKYNIRKIIIQGGENNRWINEVWEDFETPYFEYDCKNRKTIPANKGKKHLSVDIAKKIYDVFALGKGFQYDGDGNLEKEI